MNKRRHANVTAFPPPLLRNARPLRLEPGQGRRKAMEIDPDARQITCKFFMKLPQAYHVPDTEIVSGFSVYISQIKQ